MTLRNPYKQDPSPLWTGSGFARRRLKLGYRVRCRVCKRAIVGVVPRGENQPFPVRHKGNVSHFWCEGSWVHTSWKEASPPKKSLAPNGTRLRGKSWRFKSLGVSGIGG